MTEQEARVDIEEHIRAVLGAAGSAQITSVMMQASIDSALADLSRIRPKTAYVIVNTVPGQAEYTMASDVMNVLGVVFPQVDSGTSLNASLLGTDLVHAGDFGGVEFHNHSLLTIIAQKWEQFESYYGCDWEYDMDSNQVRIMPVPSQAGKVAVKVAHMREVSTLPVMLRVPFRELVQAYCMEAIAAMMVSSGITSVPIGIGNVTYSPDAVSKQGTVLRQMALNKIGHKGGAVIMG